MHQAKSPWRQQSREKPSWHWRRLGPRPHLIIYFPSLFRPLSTPSGVSGCLHESFLRRVFRWLTRWSVGPSLDTLGLRPEIPFYGFSRSATGPVSYLRASSTYLSTSCGSTPPSFLSSAVRVSSDVRRTTTAAGRQFQSYILSFSSK